MILSTASASVKRNLLEKLGARVVRQGENLVYGLGFFLEILREMVFFVRRRQAGYRVLTMQILFTGVEALPVIGVLAVALGAVIIVQGQSLLPQFGQGQLIYTILVTVITRELGPILTAFIVTARSGTAVATELGNMVASHEVEAYIAAGINPVAYLAVPRFFGITLSMVLLNLYFNVFGLFGSFVVTQFLRPIAFAEYFRGLVSAMTPTDIIASIIKSLIMGAIVAATAIYYGFRVNRATTEVPVMAIRAVGRGFVLAIIANAVVTIIYYV